ncbi:putative dolicholphosphate-mannose synthase [Leptomonas pyrrhocoris]|uniref:Putative dolicholphosphate-mannose synthase n=1 Tax=Leptomonas pyrrhocoris TaxID=157538 RepID=A0A0M9G0S8_LEPPY|nr:putative dolicholphosphate-mannose synthase [Leptomonas pyrrhocoris]XP_015658296.1 putative dolicholphosphate-mannose synthase [Leptomonas pyrrhocoris]KPA79856.1 putative dolicholphosphate-mannose synthase [Leptomonas pyrrhocoris]KPA79857.1 putative dolicholphosphate-mannose synthase [Leptomonas pyrrhocoris]|eukprot:XP_015658295.1 putative dolicholphosphate-mannose synthase [Leptomonas pyrrhocoris]
MTSEHWSFFGLPPFFTEQHSPATLDRQSALWSSLILDHAVYHAQRAPTSGEDTNALLRFYTSHSDVFYNPAIHKRLSAEAAHTMLQSLVTRHPNHAVVVSDNGPSDYSVLVCTTEGGLKQVEEGLLRFILDNGAVQTTAMLSTKGTVMTFDELAEGTALSYGQSKPVYLARSSGATVPVADVGRLSAEQAIRTYLHALDHRPVSAMRPFKVTLFNLDGSTTQPYQGVKFGGE